MRRVIKVDDEDKSFAIKKFPWLDEWSFHSLCGNALGDSSLARKIAENNSVRQVANQ